MDLGPKTHSRKISRTLNRYEKRGLTIAFEKLVDKTGDFISLSATRPRTLVQCA
jgi:hypothetical protein